MKESEGRRTTFINQTEASPQTDNHASISPLSFYRSDALPAAQPTASKHWRCTL